jgi:pyruvate dehydrogenase E1 component beta subunit
MGKITYREAVRAGLREALQSDMRIFLMGEDVGKYGGTYACSKGFLDEFGPERIRDTPLSESTFVGAGIGAALGGMKPIVEVMTVNFDPPYVGRSVQHSPHCTDGHRRRPAGGRSTFA